MTSPHCVSPATRRRTTVSGAFVAVALLSALLAAVVPGRAAAAPGHSVELRVLVVAVGTSAEDASRAYIEQTMSAVGVAYDVLDASRDNLTESRLRSGGLGHYNGVIVTNAQLTADGEVFEFTGAEWQLLYEYERDFNVRQSVLSGFPGTMAGSTDYGMATVAESSGYVGAWTGTAGAGSFPYVNTATNLPIEIAAYGAQPRNDAAVEVRPLLVDSTDASTNLVSHLVYPDGREVLLATMNQLSVLRHSQILAYEFIDFATSGVHVGARRVYLSTQVDDLFLTSAIWDPVANETSETTTFRPEAADITALANAQADLNSTHPTLNDYRVEFAFNGLGAVDDALRAEVQTRKNDFRFLNHTYTHRTLDADTGVTAADARNEILNNRATWTTLDLPDRLANDPVVVTGEHSGLTNNGGATTFPAGVNRAMIDGFEQVGIRYIAGDSSRGNQAADQYIPGSDIVLLPRYPTAVFFNVNTPEGLTDEYNYLFRESFIELGVDPCITPGAVCTPRTYEEIIDFDASTTLAHMLSHRQWPHYFHTANLDAYDAAGSTLLFDWLASTVAMYEEYVDLPIVNLPFHEIGAQTRARLAVEAADIDAVLAINTGVVTISADRTLDVELTGLTGGQAYGTKLLRTVAVTGTPQSFMVDGYVAPAGHPDAPAPTPTPSPTPTPVPTATPVPTPTPGGGSVDDTIDSPVPIVAFCDGLVATIVGTDGNDVLRGTAGRDVIHGLGGNDIIDGRGGSDVICGGRGADDINGGGGADTIFGQAGSDTIDGGSGGDTIAGGSGRDRISGKNGRDEINGGSGRDIVRGGRHADTLDGAAGNDRLIGGPGPDVLIGGPKNDVLRGNGGADTLSGNAGSDTLDGGKGTDTCSGGSGADTSTNCER